MATGDLCAAADVAAWGGPASGSSADPVIARLITAYSSMIKAYCNTPFAVTAFTEIRDGNGKSRMMLANVPPGSPVVPVTCTISSLTIGQSTTVAPRPSVGQSGYYQSKPHLVDLAGYSFDRGQGNVIIAYTAGFAAVPAEVAQACIELVVIAYRRGRTAGVSTSSATVTGENTTYDLSPIPKSTKLLLDNYRLVAPL